MHHTWNGKGAVQRVLSAVPFGYGHPWSWLLVGCKEWCWVRGSLLWGAPFVEEFSQLVDGVQLGVAYFGSCLLDCTGEDV